MTSLTSEACPARALEKICSRWQVGALLQLSDAQMAGGRAEDRAERAGRLVDGLRAQLDQVRGQSQIRGSGRQPTR